MFPSSAVAQTHVPGSTIGTLQQPPTHNHPSQHHQDNSAIIQNFSFDNRHSAYRSKEVSTSVNRINETHSEQLDAVEKKAVEQDISTTMSTDTATSPAMMVEDASATIKKTNTTAQASNNASNEKGQNDHAKPADANTNDACTTSAVRKVR
ncbi:uncharacterized protein MEPE_02225 [Melanopsichium pennsylvanicum]|uniref:Uncharacterized protein n=2 Tax=Melanopsichium pennsylvanicum TaxID=63383 RepID=A0AAJ5C4G7_9BASI|nr:uncharacterized protein MEPE_02225 [Melanopsichium pennsylvanicum]